MARRGEIAPLYRERIDELPPGVTQITVYRERKRVVLHTLKDWREVVDYFLMGKGRDEPAA